jgi:hypothetical protein
MRQRIEQRLQALAPHPIKIESIPIISHLNHLRFKCASNDRQF